jgi:hypothetical protein
MAAAATLGIAAPTEGLPPNTVTLSQMMREVSSQPGFTENFLKQIQGGDTTSDETLLTPDLITYLRELIVGKDWEGLDRFPGWTMADITPTVGALSRIAADEDNQQAKAQLVKFLDVGPYKLDSADTFDNFEEPSRLPDFAHDDVPTQLGYGVTRPDGPGPLASEHSESQRLAYVLNRLAANGLDGVAVANVVWDPERTPASPEELIDDIIDTGNTVTVTISRAFANFGQLHYKGQEVMMPVFLNTQIRVPGTQRSLLVPASHIQYEWHIRGPLLNADVAFSFAIDGKAQWRTMDELNQQWEMKHEVREYRGADAIEVTRLAAAVARTYVRLHQAHPATPFGGYYAFGVCQDVSAAIELKMTGRTTIFPNTADPQFFIGPGVDPRDAEINDLIRRLPKDRDGKPPEPERIFGSLPVSDRDFATITIPGVGADLIAVHDAWIAGKLQRTDLHWWQRIRIASILFALVAAVVLFLQRRWRKLRRS